jgi:hypothetical protein
VDGGSGNRSRKLAISALIRSRLNLLAPFVDLVASNLPTEQQQQQQHQMKNNRQLNIKNKQVFSPENIWYDIII